MNNATARHTGPTEYTTREASKGRHAYHMARDYYTAEDV